jgi:hypothetical protein
MKPFRIGIEWRRNSALALADEAALFGRLTLHVGDDCLTALYDSWDSTLAPGPYVSVYSLASWMIGNWWSLLHEPLRDGPKSEPFLVRHGFAGVMGPYSLPDLVSWRDEDRMLVQVERRSGRFEEARFLGSGLWGVPATMFQDELARFLDTVCDRLIELGHGHHDLVARWRRVSELDAEEQQFCIACGRLGLSPDEVRDDLAETLISAHDLPVFRDPDLSRQFLDAELPSSNLVQDATLVSRAVDQLGTVSPVRIPHSIRETTGAESISPSRPYEFGYDMARRFRELLNLDDRDGPPDLAALFGWAPSGEVALPRGGVAVVSRDLAGEVRLATRGGFEATKRFACCRAMFDAILTPRRLSYVASGSQLRDKAGRAFAAEFLLPAKALRREVGDVELDDQRMREIAQRYKVSELLVADQARNHGLVAGTDWS